MYYSPTTVYSPWLYNCTSGTACANANFSAALDYPVSGEPGYTSARNLAGLKYEVWVDDKGFTGTRPLRGAALNVTNTPNGQVDLWDSHVTVVLNASDAQVYLTTYAPTAAGMNPTTTLQTTTCIPCKNRSWASNGTLQIPKAAAVTAARAFFITTLDSP